MTVGRPKRLAMASAAGQQAEETFSPSMSIATEGVACSIEVKFEPSLGRLRPSNDLPQDIAESVDGAKRRKPAPSNPRAARRKPALHRAAGANGDAAEQ